MKGPYESKNEGMFGPSVRLTCEALRHRDGDFWRWCCRRPAERRLTSRPAGVTPFRLPSKTTWAVDVDDEHRFNLRLASFPCVRHPPSTRRRRRASPGERLTPSEDHPTWNEREDVRSNPRDDGLVQRSLVSVGELRDRNAKVWSGEKREPNGTLAQPTSTPADPVTSSRSPRPQPVPGLVPEEEHGLHQTTADGHHERDVDLVRPGHPGLVAP